MKLIEFKEQNVVIAKNQPQYLPMPAFVFHGSREGDLVCCWKLSLVERVKLLFLGRIWHRILTFRQPVQPVMLSVTKPELI